MSEINCSMSPLALLEDNPTHTPLESALRESAIKQTLELLHCSAFLIGSVDEMNEKMNYPLLNNSSDLLVIESMSKRNTEEALRKHSKKEAELVIDNLKSTESVKLPFKSIMTYSRDIIPASKSTEVSPKLVELQHFPGFRESEPTDLPNDTSLSMVLQKVVMAKSDLKRKPKYKSEFELLLHSPLIKAIVLDVFWWLFLHKYQPDSVAQDGFFNRISLNYVSLLIKCQSWSYGDVFLQEFVGVLSQATYSCFCCSFPQSWLQFGQNYFKTELCDLVYQWVGGIPPIAGIFQTWNCDILEPVELKETKSVTKESRRSRKGFSVSLFGPVSDNNLRSGSASFINSASSSRRRKRILPGSRVQTPRGTKIPSNDLFGKMIDNDLCPVYNNSSFIITSASVTPCAFLPFSGSIQENEKISIGRAATNVSKWRDEDNAIPYSQSYPIEYGPEFMKDKFNLFGLSPLVQNFLQKYHLEPLSGMNIYI
eukprot:gi/632987640/ref/XP_007882667.1/ PREDICTED: protein FAM227A [Callorhinchus milii]